MKFSLSNIIKSTILLEGRLENVVKKYADEINQSDIEVIEYLSEKTLWKQQIPRLDDQSLFRSHQRNGVRL